MSHLSILTSSRLAMTLEGTGLIHWRYKQGSSTRLQPEGLEGVCHETNTPPVTSRRCGTLLFTRVLDVFRSCTGQKQERRGHRRVVSKQGVLFAIHTSLGGFLS